MTGCAVTGDIAGLIAGRRTELGLQSRVKITDAAYVKARVARAAIPGHTAPGFTQRDASQPVIILDSFPPYVSTDDIAISIDQRARDYAWKARHPELAERTGLPIKHLSDLTSDRDYWFVCVPSTGTEPEALRDQLLKVHGVTVYISVALPRPLPAMIRTWVRTHQHEDLHASLTALESALPSRPRKR